MQKFYSVSSNTITPPNNGNGENQILWLVAARKLTEENPNADKKGFVK